MLIVWTESNATSCTCSHICIAWLDMAQRSKWSDKMRSSFRGRSHQQHMSSGIIHAKVNLRKLEKKEENFFPFTLNCCIQLMNQKLFYINTYIAQWYIPKKVKHFLQIISRFEIYICHNYFVYFWISGVLTLYWAPNDQIKVKLFWNCLNEHFLL